MTGFIRLDPRTGLPVKRGGSAVRSGVAGGVYPPVDTVVSGAFGPLPPLGTPGPSFGGGGGASPAPKTSYDDFIAQFKGLIEGDPLYKQNLADLSAQGIADAASRKAARQRAIAQFGIVPDFNSVAAGLGTTLGPDLEGDVDAVTRGLAKSNTDAGFSTAARLSQQHEKNVREIQNALEQRGLFHSGALGATLGEEQRAYDTSNYDATEKLLDYLAGVQAAYTQSERARAGSQGDAAQAAAQRQFELWTATHPNGSETSAATATPPPPNVANNESGSTSTSTSRSDNVRAAWRRALSRRLAEF